MDLKPMANYFIVRINKETQKEREEKIGSILLHPSYIFMTRGCQAGQIVAIGKKASESFPEATVGDVLLFNHFVEKKKDNRGYACYFIADDQDFNYYGVNGVVSEGERNMVYAVWNGTELIPNKENVFLEIEKPETSDLEEYSMPMMMSAGGLVIPKPRKKTRADLIAEMEANKKKIFRLSNERLLSMSDVKAEVRNLEKANDLISKEINKGTYQPYKVAAFNPELKESLPTLEKGSILYTFNKASQYVIEFMNVEYLVVSTDYVGAIGS